MNTNRRHAVAALRAAGLLWGTTVPLSKLALEWLSPGWLTVVRFGLAAAVLLAVARRRPGGRTAQGPAQRSAQRSALRAAFTPGVLIAGAFGYGGSVMVQNAGIGRTSVTHAALLIGAVPVLVAIIAAVWYRAVARPVAWFGFAVSLGGVGLVTTGSGGGGATMAGDGLVLASLLLSAMVTVAQGRLLAGRDPVAVTAVQFLGATLGSLPIAAVSEGVPAAPAGAGVVLAVVALALAGTLLPFTLFAFGQSRVSAEVAGAFLNLEPLVGAIAGAVVFGDPAGLAQAGGGAAILAGIALSSLPLLAGRRVARRAEAVVAAGTSAGAGAGSASTSVAAERVGASAGVGLGLAAGGVGAEPPRRTKPPSPGPAAVRARVDSGKRRGGRNGGFVVVRSGKFGVGGPGGGRQGLAGAGRPPGRERGTGRGARRQRTRPGGRVAGRPPARRRGPIAGGGLGGSGQRVTGGRGRSWPGARRGRSAAGR
ncbi:MAG TPA: DMT family transporter [Streptosporangiaceae bacterium]|nr:DMT family transporter [Streptosporangiaceae bacterium]